MNAIASITGLFSALTPGTLLLGQGSASTFAEQVDWVNWFITLVSLFFLVLITAVMVYFAVKYRRVEGRRSEASPTHNMPLEMTWSVVPLILVIVMFYLGLIVYADMRHVPLNAYEVDVIARKWSWEFRHRESGAIEIDELTIPMDRPVKLRMVSEDVLHSFYVPAFRAKMDVVPGRTTMMWFQATRPNTTEEGGYDLYCAEYCGTGHSDMIGRVYVYPQEDFPRRIQEIAEWMRDIDDEDLWYKAGPRMYARCQACHILTPVTPEVERTLTAPSLWNTHELLKEGGTRRMTDGREIVVDEDYIRRSLLNPREDVNEGFAANMPVFTFSEREILALTGFIRNLDKFDGLEEGRPVVRPEYLPARNDVNEQGDEGSNR